MIPSAPSSIRRRHSSASFRALRCTAMLLLFLAAGLRGIAEELTVFAAASLSDALTEIGPLFRGTTGCSVQYNFGASGTLLRQIKAGAAADVFFSADEDRMNQLAQAGLVVPGTRHTVLMNQLVVVVPIDEAARVSTVRDLADRSIRRIAVGEPATVPAGAYAKEYLEKEGSWSRLGERFVPLENVRAVLAAVASGNADAGFVYRTDAAISRRVRIAFAIPVREGPVIRYPVSVLRESTQPAAARAFVAFLLQPPAEKVFAKYGFIRPE